MLTCECGKKIVVTSAQAGRQVTCESCNRQNHVPTLRGLAQLPEIIVDGIDSAASLSPKTNASPWGWRGPVFAILALVWLISLTIGGYYLKNWWQVDTSIRVQMGEKTFVINSIESNLAFQYELLDHAGADELSKLWDDYSNTYLRHPIPPYYKQLADYSASTLRKVAISLLVTAMLSLAIAGLWLSAKRHVPTN
ncbi:MAG: hypothetical protein KF752_18750 [Pirellulaceae bacterium]|nr:hypothetical protein [Pirellulaceae bacterium]